MKKVSILSITALVMFAFSVSAQSPEELQASKDRRAKLEAMKAPASCGVASIDNLAAGAKAAMDKSLAISSSMDSLRNASVMAVSAGALDPAMKSKQETDYNVLKERIKTQASDIQALSATVPAVASDIAKASLVQKVMATKSLSYSKDMMTILLSESAFQVKNIDDIVKSTTM